MMDSRKLEDLLVKDSEAGVLEKKHAVTETLARGENQNQGPKLSCIDSAGALQLFLDHIHISSISDIIIKNPFPEVEAKTADTVGYIMNLMREKDMKSAPIVHKFTDEHEQPRFAEEYIGLIDFDTMILWFLQECDKSRAHSEDEAKGFFSMFEENHPVLQTKVGELAKLFLWDPFFPIHANDSLFHVLLLLSKHRLKIVPVTEESSSKIIGFVSQNAVICALLEASGLEWFDKIADKALSECRQKHDGGGSIAVVQPETEKLIGSLRTTDLYLFVEDTDLYSNRKHLKVKDYIQLDAETGTSESSTEKFAALPSTGSRSSRSESHNNYNFRRRTSPITNRESDILREAMKKFAASTSNVSFLIDECDRVKGLITLRDIMAQFAPPGIDSRRHGGGFFESALQQAGCHISGGIIQLDKKSTSRCRN